jgi:hypothetical protein
MGIVLGDGLIFIKIVSGGEGQDSSLAITIIFASMVSPVVLAEATNGGICPVSEAASPIAVLSFTHDKLALGGIEDKTGAITVSNGQTQCIPLPLKLTCGICLIRMY